MSIYRGPNIVKNGLIVLLDTNNPNCVDASQSITSGTLLNNLYGDKTFQFAPYDITNNNMTFVDENGNYVYNQNGINGGYPCWYSTTNLARTDDYTFICWFKYTYGSSYQRINNIYGGGFDGKTSFYLSPGGTSEQHGALRYSDGGNAYTVLGNWGGNDNNWHQFAAVDWGGDGSHTTRILIDGVYKGESTSDGTYITPKGSGRMTWGSWSNSYGNFNGRTNLYMYYNRKLSDNEVLQNFNAYKKRFNIT